MVADLRPRRVDFTSRHESLDTPRRLTVFLRRPGGVLPELIVSGMNETLAAAHVAWRPGVVKAVILRTARDMLPNTWKQNPDGRAPSRCQRRDPVQPTFLTTRNRATPYPEPAQWQPPVVSARVCESRLSGDYSLHRAP